jgi:hypothetical protein
MVFSMRLHKTTSTYGWDWELMIGEWGKWAKVSPLSHQTRQTSTARRKSKVKSQKSKLILSKLFGE